MSEIEELKRTLDLKVKFVDSFKIFISGKPIIDANNDYCNSGYFFPEILCVSPDLDKINRLRSVLIRYALNKYLASCENTDFDSTKIIDQEDDSYSLYVAARRPNVNFLKKPV